MDCSAPSSLRPVLVLLLFLTEGLWTWLLGVLERRLNSYIDILEWAVVTSVIAYYVIIARLSNSAL